MVASDRISTYDAVHPTPIPDKGKVLTGLSVFWFERTAGIVANHMISTVEGVPEEALGRALVVRRLNMLPVECVVRGYITGSGWKDYQATGRVSGIELPAGLRESERLPEPIFTPSTKADEGHDEAIDLGRAKQLVGDGELMGARARRLARALFHAAEHAREHGVILADTKFEFGLDGRGELVVGDEVLTPDSSRYWPADWYQPGRAPAELRQAIRARLGGSERLGQAPARAGAARRRRGRHARALRAGLRAPHRRAIRRVACAHRRSGGVRARVLIRPKAGILDPQGEAVERALPALGFDGVANVHVGRLVELDVPDPAELAAMCEKLLANPLVEDYDVELLDGDA